LAAGRWFALLAAPVGRAIAPTSDPILKAIWAEGIERSKADAWPDLMDSIGPLACAPGMKAASDWAIAMYGSWGVPARAEASRHLGWRRGWRTSI
jgi:hypothetical protein